MILRAKNKELFHYDNLTDEQIINQKKNISDADNRRIILESKPRRIVCELTNACNLSCIMCGRNAWDFKLTRFKLEWFNKISSLLNTAEEVTLMGWGEPTVHPQFTDILKFLNKYPVKKYFCTNGMKLGELTESIFENHVDIIAVSLDGANKDTNDRIRRGADFDKIISNIKKIMDIRRDKKLNYPYMNFVFTAMEDNYKQIPDVVDLAADVGIDEVKIVYFTSFRSDLDDQTLLNKQDMIIKVFDDAVDRANKKDILMKLPYIQGQDPAGCDLHRPCYSVWRDLFIGSDGYLRPCMSTPIKFKHIDDIDNIEQFWNSDLYQKFRFSVNDNENMPESCKTCYQSSVTNWNQSRSFIQHGLDFAPDWDDKNE